MNERDDILDEDFVRQGFNNEEEGLTVKSITKTNFIALYFTSFGLYAFWWMFKVWKRYRDHEGLDVNPALRAIFAIIFMFGLFEKIQSDARSKGYGKKYFSALLLLIFITSGLVSRLPDPYWLVTYLGFICYLQPLNAHNFYLDKSHLYNLKISQGFNNRQRAIIVIGGLFWLLILIGTILGE